jgi:SAM-dependent methyltransferase
MNLKQLYKLFDSHPENKYLMKYYNALLLYKFIKHHPIKRVLDLGTGLGLSAAVCALAFKDKGETDYHIDSVEQFDKCIKLANELIPKELTEHTTIHRSEVKVWQHPQIPYQFFSNYETLPEGDYDLIINDGPCFYMDEDIFIDLPNGTITEIMDRIKPGTFVAWDGRIHALNILERFCADNFELYRVNQRGDDLNILRRLDTPPTFRDDKEDTTFFKDNEKETMYPTDRQTTPSKDETSNTGASKTL